MFHLNEGSWETVCEVSANNVRKSEEQTPEPWRCDVLIMLTFDSMPSPFHLFPQELSTYRYDKLSCHFFQFWNFGILFKYTVYVHFYF